MTAPQTYDGSSPTFDNDGDVAPTTGWAPLRIQAHFAGQLGSLAASTRIRSQGTERLRPLLSVTRQAVAFWESALKVAPVAAPVLLPRSCPSNTFLEFPGSEWDGACLGPELPGQPVCGVDGLSVPEALLGSMKFCAALKDVPGSCRVVGQRREEEDEEGVPVADFHLFVVARATRTCHTQPGLLAYATSCARDQFGRPIAGTINFCPSGLTGKGTGRGGATTALDAKAIEATRVATAKHELAHALGFSSSSFALFRDRNGRKRVASSAKSFTFACGVGGGGASGRREFTDPHPVLQRFSERGAVAAKCPCPVGASDGNPPDLAACVNPSRRVDCVMRLTTPNVRRETNRFFGCASGRIPGAELENEATAACAMVGSHWEQRVLRNELMTASGFTGMSKVLSRVTLALFEDSGWYRPDYSKADRLVKGVHWGYHQGCDFAMSKCLVPPSSSSTTSALPVSIGSPPHFCAAGVDDGGSGSGTMLLRPGRLRAELELGRRRLSTAGTSSSGGGEGAHTSTSGRHCTLDRHAQGNCDLVQFLRPLPTRYRYFQSPTLGSKSRQTDRCPIIAPYSNRICTSAEQQIAPSLNFQGQVFGATSRCFESTLNSVIASRTQVDPVVGCYRVVCGPPGAYTLVVQTSGSQAGGDGDDDDDAYAAGVRRQHAHAQQVQVRCEQGDEGQRKTVRGFTGSVVCVDPRMICPLG